MNAQSYRILRLHAENVKRLHAVDITPSGDVVRITGRNGQGKSSVLDAMLYALGGGRALPRRPIRDGADKAQITIDLGDFRVRRSITASGSSLIVEMANGARSQRHADDTRRSLTRRRPRRAPMRRAP